MVISIRMSLDNSVKTLNDPLRKSSLRSACMTASLKALLENPDYEAVTMKVGNTRTIPLSIPVMARRRFQKIMVP